MMHEFLYYDERTGEITGSFRTSTPDLLPKPLAPYQRSIQVTDDDQRVLLRERRARTAKVAGVVREARIVSLRLEPRFTGRVALSCDRPDLDGDGLPELPADGQSTARITATLVTPDDTTATESSASVRFQVSRGSLSKRQSAAERGAAYVDLRSVNETIRVDVTATAEGFEPAAMTIEIIPVDEYEALSRSRNPR